MVDRDPHVPATAERLKGVTPKRVFEFKYLAESIVGDPWEASKRTLFTHMMKRRKELHIFPKRPRLTLKKCALEYSV